MMLNSMWGKFGQHLNKTQVKEFDDPKPFTVSWIPCMYVMCPSSTTSSWKCTININKNYGYKTKKGKVECKVWGFRLNSEGKTQFNYDVMRHVLDEIQKPQKEPRQTQVVKTYQIVCDAKTYDLNTLPDYKRYQLVYDKSHRSQYLSNLPLRIPSNIVVYWKQLN